MSTEFIELEGTFVSTGRKRPSYFIVASSQIVHVWLDKACLIKLTNGHTISVTGDAETAFKQLQKVLGSKKINPDSTFSYTPVTRRNSDRMVN